MEGRKRFGTLEAYTLETKKEKKNAGSAEKIATTEGEETGKKGKSEVKWGTEQTSKVTSQVSGFPR